MIDDAQVFLPDLLDSHATWFPDREAVVCGQDRRTWGAFNLDINRIAHALLDRGLEKGQRVAVMMGNSVQMLEVLFGCIKAGACVVPLSGLLTGEQLVALTLDSDAVAVIASPEFREKLRPLRSKLSAIDPDMWVATESAESGWTPIEVFVAGAASTRPPVRYDMGDAFNIIYSSGTTGLPKGIVQTHRARQHFAWSNAVEMGYTDRSRALSTTALYSNGTWLVMLPALFAGATLVVMPTFGAREFLRLVQDERITHTFMVPSQYLMVLAEPTLAGADHSSLQMMLCAGSPLRRDTKREVIAQFGNKLHELYGYSEGFATLLKPHHPATKFDTVGVPVLGFELRILDDDGHELPRGQAGEVAGYGAGMMKEYHKRADLTEAMIWRDERGRTFLRSGDIGKLDADGYLSLVDRKKDMIISGGYNVFPSDIETVIGGHEDVFDVTVIGVPHEKWGETPLALVIRKPGARASEEAIVQWANQRLARHQRVARAVFRQEFPRNALGKVLKRVLRDEYS